MRGLANPAPTQMVELTEGDRLTSACSPPARGNSESVGSWLPLSCSTAWPITLLLFRLQRPEGKRSR